MSEDVLPAPPPPPHSLTGTVLCDEEAMAPLLSEVVCEEDKRLIMDVLHAIRMCRGGGESLCTSWTVTPEGTGYVLVAYLPRVQASQGMQAVEVTHDDIHLVESVNSFRVRVGVAQFAHGSGGGAPSWGLRVRITSHLSAISFSTYDPIRIGVRRSLLVSDRHRDGGAQGAGSGGGGGGWLASLGLPQGLVQGISGASGQAKRRRSGGMG